MSTGNRNGTEDDSGDEPFDGSTIVDTDVHVGFAGPVVESAVERMDEPWAGFVDPERTGDRYRYPSPGLPKPQGGRKEFLVEPEKNAGNTHPDLIREALLEEFGIDYPILNVLSATERAWKTDRVVAEMSAINDVLVEEFLEGNDDYHGLLSVTFRDPDAAVEEIERFGDHDQVVGIFVFSGTYHQKPPGDPSYDVIYEALAANDMTPAFHVTNFVSKAPFLQEYENLFAWHAIAQSWSIQHAVLSLLSQGVPEKFPELDFVMLEGGVTWIPWAMARLNREHGQWKSELPLLERTPEEMIRDQFYFTTQPLEEFTDPADMKRVFEVIGADSLVFSSDYPHYDFDSPGALEGILGTLSEVDRRKVLSENAIEAFGLDV